MIAKIPYGVVASQQAAAPGLAYPSGALVLLEASTLSATLSDGDPVAAWPVTQGFQPTVNGTFTFEAAHPTLGPAVVNPAGSNGLNTTGMTDASSGITFVIAAELDLSVTLNDSFFDAELGRTLIGLRAAGRPFLFDGSYRTLAVDEAASSPALLTFVVDGDALTLTVYQGRSALGSVPIGAYNGIGGRSAIFTNYLGNGSQSKKVGLFGIWPGVAEATRTAIWDAAHSHYPTLVSAPSTATPDPLAIFGSSLAGWWEPNGLVLSGADVTAWNDTGPAGNDLTVANGAPKLSSLYSDRAVLFDGTTSLEAAAPVDLGPDTITWAVLQLGPNVTTVDRIFSPVATALEIRSGSSNPEMVEFRVGGTTLTGTVDAQAQPRYVVGTLNSTGSSLRVDGAEITTGPVYDPTAGTFAIGAQSGNATPAEVTVVEAGIVDGTWTAGQLAQLEAYLEYRYGSGVVSILQRVIPNVSNLWAADAMTAGSDPALIDQVGTSDLTLLNGTPTLNASDPAYNGNASLSVDASNGGYQNALLNLDGPITTITLLETSDLTTGPYIIDGSAASGRGYTYLNTSPQTVSTLGPNVVGVPNVNTPFLLVQSKEAAGVSNARSYASEDGASTALTPSIGTSYGPFTGFTLGADYQGNIGLPGKMLFAAVCDNYAMTQLEFVDLVAHLNKIYGLNMPVFNPMTIFGSSTLWWEPSGIVSSGGTVTSWTSSGYPNTLTAVKVPALVSLNGKDAVSFDGVQDYMQGSFVDLIPNNLIWAVARVDGTPNSGGIFNMGAYSADYGFETGSVNVGEPEAVYNGGSIASGFDASLGARAMILTGNTTETTFRMNGIEIATGAPYNPGFDSPTVALDGSGTTYGKVTIAEMGIVNGAWTEEKLALLEIYLRVTYGLW